MKINNIITSISGLLAIINFVKDYLKDKQISFSIITIVFSVIFILTILISLIKKDIKYEIYKYISYIIRSPKLSYNTIKKEIEYSYKTRYQLSYRKKEIIKARNNGMNSWTGRFRWTKPQKKFNVKCLSKHNNLRLSKNGTWNNYTVDFDSAKKGDIREIEILVDELFDPKEESEKQLSSTIHEKIETIIYIVNISNDVELNSIRFLIYANSDEFPKIEEIYQFGCNKKNKYIEYDATNKTIKVCIKYPINGYRYKLEWTFK